MIDILGIDCATDPRNTGVAHATLDDSAAGGHGRAFGGNAGGRRNAGEGGNAGGHAPAGTADTPQPVLRYLASGSPAVPTAETLARLLTPGRPAIVGLDAPLGWPAAMGRVLVGHRAGMALNLSANDLFRRQTDRVVRERIGKQPLDVGADRIARTAVAALDLLAELRRLTGRALPVATREAHIPRRGRIQGIDERGIQLPEAVTDASVEVYPAGRLIALHGEGYRRGYRGSDRAAQDIRRAMLRDLEAEIIFEADAEAAVADVDLLDAIICVCAAVDVLRGRCTPPEALDLPLHEIDREGWIWLPLGGGY